MAPSVKIQIADETPTVDGAAFAETQTLVTIPETLRQWPQRSLEGSVVAGDAISIDPLP